MQEAPAKSTAKYLLSHHTLLEVCGVRRGAPKIGLLLSLSLISLLTLFTPNPFIFAFVGSVVVYTYFFIKMAITHSTDEADG